MARILSPLDINVLLHIYAIAEPFPNPSWAYCEAISRYLATGVIVKTDESPSGYRTTPLGDAWVTLLCQTPRPSQSIVPTFVDPRTGAVITV